jgi:hypothetical protein
MRPSILESGHSVGTRGLFAMIRTFSRQPENIHSSIPDPAAGHADDDASYPAFQQTAAELETRIGFLLAALTDRTTHPDTRGGAMPELSKMVNVRYMVDDVDTASLYSSGRFGSRRLGVWGRNLLSVPAAPDEPVHRDPARD